jgi:hypothetical protein
MNVHFVLAMSLCFYVFYIFALAVVMFRRRKAAIVNKEISFSYFKNYSGDEIPDDLIVMARHFDNQFQVPMIFMVTGSLLLTFVHLPAWVAILAWVFVLSRVVHTRIHLGGNVVLNRAKVYLLGWLVLFVLWIKIVITFL